MNRADRLISRSILYEADYNEVKKAFQPANNGDFSNQRPILQITEKFLPSTSSPSDDNENDEISELIYFLDEDKIHVTYHRKSTKVSPNSREFQKPTIGGSGAGSDTAIAGTGSIPVWDIDDCHCYSNEISTDETTPKITEQNSGKDKIEISDKPTHRVLFAQMKDLMVSEVKTIKQVRLSEEEIQETLKDRASEERSHKLKVSIYDTKRNLKAQERRQELERLAKEDAERRNDQSMDYLAPFLAKAGLDSNDPDLLKKMTKDTAIKLKNDCLYHMKMRMVQKANVIQERFNNETKELERRQSIYQRKQAHNNNKVDEEEYVNFCQDSTFRIHILEKRLAEHKKQGARDVER